MFGIISAAVLLAIPPLTLVSFGSPTLVSADNLPWSVTQNIEVQIDDVATDAEPAAVLLNNWAYTGNDGCGDGGHGHGSPHHSNGGRGCQIKQIIKDIQHEVREIQHGVPDIQHEVQEIRQLVHRLVVLLQHHKGHH